MIELTLVNYDDRTIIFSLYQDPSSIDEKLNFNYQIVNKKNYYPTELKFLIDKINRSESTIEKEIAIDNYNNFIQNLFLRGIISS